MRSRWLIGTVASMALLGAGCANGGSAAKPQGGSPATTQASGGSYSVAVTEPDHLHPGRAQLAFDELHVLFSPLLTLDAGPQGPAAGGGVRHLRRPADVDDQAQAGLDVPQRRAGHRRQLRRRLERRRLRAQRAREQRAAGARRGLRRPQPGQGQAEGQDAVRPEGRRRHHVHGQARRARQPVPALADRRRHRVPAAAQGGARRSEGVRLGAGRQRPVHDGRRLEEEREHHGQALRRLQGRAGQGRRDRLQVLRRPQDRLSRRAGGRARPHLRRPGPVRGGGARLRRSAAEGVHAAAGLPDLLARGQALRRPGGPQGVLAGDRPRGDQQGALRRPAAARDLDPLARLPGRRGGRLRLLHVRRRRRPSSGSHAAGGFSGALQITYPGGVGYDPTFEAIGNQLRKNLGHPGHQVPAAAVRAVPREDQRPSGQGPDPRALGLAVSVDAGAAAVAVRARRRRARSRPTTPTRR